MLQAQLQLGGGFVQRTPRRHQPRDEAVHRQAPLPAALAVPGEHALNELESRGVGARVEAAADGLDDGFRAAARHEPRKLRAGMAWLSVGQLFLAAARYDSLALRAGAAQLSAGTKLPDSR